MVPPTLGRPCRVLLDSKEIDLLLWAAFPDIDREEQANVYTRRWRRRRQRKKLLFLAQDNANIDIPRDICIKLRAKDGSRCLGNITTIITIIT